MSLVSGLNVDSQIIHDGAPVAGQFSRLQLDRVILAGGSILAAGLAKSGAIIKGVVNVYTEGVVDLSNWSKVTGTQYLIVGQTYRLSNQFGKLTTTGNGQLIGLAVSRQQLSLQIGLGSGGTSTSVSTSGFATTTQLASETALRVAGDNALTATIVAEVAARIAAIQYTVGNGPPAFVPTVSPAIYTDVLTGGEYRYYNGAWH